MNKKIQDLIEQQYKNDKICIFLSFLYLVDMLASLDPSNYLRERSVNLYYLIGDNNNMFEEIVIKMNEQHNYVFDFDKTKFDPMIIRELSEGEYTTFDGYSHSINNKGISYLRQLVIVDN